MLVTMLEIRTLFRPYRLKLSRKEPVELTLTITNRGPGSALTSFEMNCDKAISFDKGGFKTTESANLGELAAGQVIEKYFQVYGKPVTRLGTYPITVKATEHFNTYNLIKKEYTKKTELIVEE